MSRHELIKQLENEQLKKEIPGFRVGDTVKVSTKIVEGEKERIQVFQGTVIARKGSGLSETFSLHRVSYDEGMERVFYLHSPRIAKIEVVKRGDVRRSKLYHLRGKTGKAAKIQEKVISKTKAEKRSPRSSDVTNIQKAPKAVKVEAAVESVSSEEIEQTKAF